MVKMKCSRNISLSDLWVGSHDKLSDFYASSWQRGDSPLPLLLVRVVLLGMTLAILAWSVYSAPNPYWLIFLTNWGLVMVSAMLLSGVFVSFKAYFSKDALDPDSDKKFLPWYVSMHWFLTNVSVTMAIVITCLYWTLIFDYESTLNELKTEGGTATLVMDIMTHAVNSFLALLALVVSRTPVRALHVLQPLSVGLWYGAFTAIYYAAGGTNGDGMHYIYEVLDWREARRSMVVVTSAALGLLIIFAVLYGVALARDKFTGWLLRTTSVKLAHFPPDIPRGINDLV